jgi:two-component system response regulator YesN
VKYLIADDERLVRFTLKSMLEEIGVPSRSIQAASDGQELLDAVSRSSPDVAFVDIRMPRLDGLAAIERARALSPGTRWVILTSHSSFEYARKAIQLGVADYLLKPVSPSELERVISKIAGEIRQELVQLNDEFQARISSLLHGTLSLEAETVEFVSTARYTGGLLLFDSAHSERRLVEKQRVLYGEIRARILAGLEKGTRIALVTLPVGQAALVCAWQPGAGEAHCAESMRGFLHSIQPVLDSSVSPEVRVTQIDCGHCDSFESLLGRLTRANAAAAMRIPLGIGRQLDLEEVEREESTGRWEALCSGLSGVAQAARSRNRLDYLAGLEKAERGLEALDRASREAVAGPLARFLAAAVGFATEASFGSPAWHEEIRGLAQTLRAEEETAGELVSQVVEFVRGNYMRDIGIGQIAFHLGVTPNYLSSLFHREKAVTFVRYLTGLRMEKARELLAMPGALVQDVARVVGYASVRHFSRLFQRQFGAYPSEVVRMEKSAPGS